MWPPPLVDSDILWLRPEAAPSVVQAGGPAPAAQPVDELSLAQVATAVQCDWHDAVAVVAQIADEVVPDRNRPPVGALPSLAAIRLASTGRINVLLDAGSAQSLRAGFGSVLQALLQDKPAPANLRLLAWRAASGTSDDMTVAEIVGELERWERPGRVGKLKNLFERARAAGPLTMPAAAVEPAPVQPAVVESPAAAAPPILGDAPRSKARTGIIVAGAIGCVAVGGLTAWLLLPRGRVDAPLAPTPTTAVGDIELETSRGTRANTAHDSSRRPTSIRPGVGVPMAPRAAGTSRGGAAVNAPFASSSASSSTSTATEAGRAPIAERSATAVAPDIRIYRAGDAGVTEPVLVKPHLPLRPRPDIPESALGVLEIVVSARGLVESVHLNSPANRYREKWWLFTAKDWRFDPARKDGVGVRFLVRIPLTDLNLAEPQ